MRASSATRSSTSPGGAGSTCPLATDTRRSGCLGSGAWTTLTAETTELLQALIRNALRQRRHPDSGDEVRNADLLQTYLEGAGLDVARYDSRPGRHSIVARIEGRDPTAPTLCLMGHTDVVPVNPDGWSRDPFGGELVDGEVWGRGAIDMLNVTASMAVAFRHLARDGFRPKGTLIYFGVADEEAGGAWGAKHMVEHHWDAVGADYVLTELGGWSSVGHDGTRAVTVNIAEKGLAWRRLRVARHARARLDALRRRQRPAHGGRGRPPPRRRSAPAQPRRPLAGPDRPPRAARRAPGRACSTRPGRRRHGRRCRADVARLAHACSHTTISPNVIHGGQKTNTIPDVVDIDVDIRTVPGDTQETSTATCAKPSATSPTASRSRRAGFEATRSPIGNPLWDALAAPHPGRLPGRRAGAGPDHRRHRRPLLPRKGASPTGPRCCRRRSTFESFG